MVLTESGGGLDFPVTYDTGAGEDQDRGSVLSPALYLPQISPESPIWCLLTNYHALDMAPWTKGCNESHIGRLASSVWKSR